MKECENCGEEIPAGRLKARPNTTLCVICQELEEKAGNFKRSRIEISQELSGWQCESINLKLIPGDE